jgi:hypothetical protein
MQITLKLCDKEEEWDGVLERSSCGTIFHKWRWLKIVEKHSKTRMYPLICIKDGDPIGLYPLFLRKKFFMRMVFSPPPNIALLYLGPVMADGTTSISFADFQKAVDDYLLREIRADYVLIHTAPELKDFRPFKENGYQVKPVYGYSLDLSCGVAPLWDGLDKKLRRSIKKAQEAGVLIKEGAKDEINVIYELMDKRYLAQDKYVGVSREYLSDVYESFKGNLKVYVAEHEGIIQTGVIDVGYRGKIRSWIGNPKTSLKNIYPNDLLFWKALESEQEQGYKRYEVMGAAGVERLHSYYANYNPLLEVNYSAVKYSSFRSVLMERMYLCFFRGLLDTIGIRKKLWN